MANKAERLRNAIAKIEATEERRLQEKTKRKQRLRNLQEQLGTVTGSIVILVTSCDRYGKEYRCGKGGNRKLTEVGQCEEGLVWKKDGHSDRLLICEPGSKNTLLAVDVGRTVGFKTQSDLNPLTTHFVVQVFKTYDDIKHTSKCNAIWPYVKQGPTFILR